MSGLFQRKPAPTAFLVPLRLLPEERSELATLFGRMTLIAPAGIELGAVNVTLGGLSGTKGFQITKEQAVWLARFTEARLPYTHGTLQRALDHLRGLMLHNLAFKCGVVL